MFAPPRPFLSVHCPCGGSIESSVRWVLDFGDLKKAVKPIVEELDHYYLNEIPPGLENPPTSEVLAQWLWARIRPDMPELTQITVRETCTSGCTYRG